MFVGLHIHSDYSLLDGASQLPDLVDRAVELGMPAIALTDHGVMYGAIELLKVCRNKGVKPIIGNEMYVINDDIEVRHKRIKRYHQVVLAKNTQGYKNLVKLTTISNLKGIQGTGIFARPCINKELLKQYREGLIVTSACLGGEVPQAILQRRPDVARRVAQEYKDIFGEDYYLEIQDHGSKEDRIVNVEIVKIAQELGIKVVATNDSHFISCYDVEAHDALLCIQTGKLIVEDKRLRYSGTEYLKSAEEMAQLFRDHLPDEVIKEAIANTLEVADKVEPYNIMGSPRIPDYPVPPEHTADTYLEKLAWDGLLERLGRRSRSEIDPVYKERMETELKVLQQMGFSTYFLVVWDYIKFARDRQIPVGPGRGSAAGSLVAYCLKITNIDPVHHGLLFERFLNPERKSMPDIDTDFCIERRDEMIKYVTEKYGEDRVAQIITFNRMTSKAVLKDVARVLNIPYGDADQMAKLIPVARGKPAKLKVMISDETPAPEFKQKYESDPNVRRWVDMAMRIEGTNKTFGVHAAGVVIAAEPLDEIVPLQKNNDGAVITQYFMEDIESMGLLKMDFLGLKNLTIIKKAVDLIKLNHNLELDPDQIPRDERKAFQILSKGQIKKMPEDIQKTYKVLEAGDLEGIFQLESSGMRQVVRDLKPSCIEDISSILALYRPGPLDAGLIPKFIDRKHGREDIQYEHEILEPILQETYAVLVYQEQIMKLAQDLAGYSLGQADLLRRAMGKKKPEEMQKHRVLFVDGAAQNGISKALADNLFEQMLKFAEYCFNKSHSTAYGYVTYQTAYLKANYPVEYMAALLSANSDNQDKVKAYLNNCQASNIEIEGPDINRSGVEFTPIGQKILFGLSAVKNVGENAIHSILEARKTDGPFRSLADLCDRVDLRAVNRRTLETLIHCGAFDKLNPNRRQLVRDLPFAIDWAQSRAKDRAVGQINLFDMMGDTHAEGKQSNAFESAPAAPPAADYSQQEKLQIEKELLGFYLSDHPLKSLHRATQNIGLSTVSLSRLAEVNKRTKVCAIAILTEVKKVVTKKSGEEMAILKIEDMETQADAVVFPETYKKIGSLIEPDARLILWGKVSQREDNYQIVIDDAVQIEPDRLVVLQLNYDQVSDAQFRQHLLVSLQEQSGEPRQPKVPVIGIIAGQSSRYIIRFGHEFWVQDCETTVNRLSSSSFSVSLQPLSQ
ncbi:DNA polymerase III subunit alpha [Kamptonema cortianum]|nr:DNA polymerase III subunit alpha [Kamptonema cortianum]